MKNTTIITLLIMALGCSENVQKEDATHANNNNIEAQDTNVVNASQATIDTNLYKIAVYLRSKNEKLISQKPHYQFKRDTIFVDMKDSILLFNYSIKDISEYYYYSAPPISRLDNQEIEYSEKMKEALELKRKLIEFLKKANKCTGLTYPCGNKTESGMVDAWQFETEQLALQAETLYNQSDDNQLKHYMFYKTASFSLADGKVLYIFHSRYTGASWQGKRYFEWFKKEQTKHLIKHLKK